MDEVGKQRVKDALIGQAEAELRSSRTNVTRQDSAAELDPDSSFSVDDQSQSDEAGDMGRLLEGVADRQAGILKQIRTLDFEITSAVAPGALVGFDGDRYVVGVVAAPFDCDGVTYEGLSTDAPIYPALEGLRLGDTFSFGGHDHRIDFLA